MMPWNPMSGKHWFNPHPGVDESKRIGHLIAENYTWELNKYSEKEDVSVLNTLFFRLAIPGKANATPPLPQY